MQAQDTTGTTEIVRKTLRSGKVAVVTMDATGALLVAVDGVPRPTEELPERGSFPGPDGTIHPARLGNVLFDPAQAAAIDAALDARPLPPRERVVKGMGSWVARLTGIGARDGLCREVVLRTQTGRRTVGAIGDGLFEESDGRERSFFEVRAGRLRWLDEDTVRQMLRKAADEPGAGRSRPLPEADRAIEAGIHGWLDDEDRAR